MARVVFLISCPLFAQLTTYSTFPNHFRKSPPLINGNHFFSLLDACVAFALMKLNSSIETSCHRPQKSFVITGSHTHARLRYAGKRLSLLKHFPNTLAHPINHGTTGDFLELVLGLSYRNVSRHWSAPPASLLQHRPTTGKTPACSPVVIGFAAHTLLFEPPRPRCFLKARAPR